MKTYIIFGIVLVVLFLIFFYNEYFQSKRYLKKIFDKANKEFGGLSSKPLSADEMESVKTLFYRYSNINSIDDITASDLELDEIYNRFNVSLSAPGRDYLYYRMRTPEYDDNVLADFEKKVDYFYNNQNDAKRLRSYFFSIGKMRKVNFFDCIDFFDTITEKNLFFEYFCIIIILLSIGLTCFIPETGVIVLVSSLIFNIITYYKRRGDIESYIICFSFISNFIKNGESIARENIDIVSDDMTLIKDLCKELKPFSRNAGILGSKALTGAGNPLDIFYDYARMIFHLDIIRFYKMLRFVKLNKNSIEELYLLIGKLETYISVASLRLALPSFCVPSSGTGYDAINMYHPLISEPVKNSISVNKGVLITGSNASGKSTFLKTAALNALFSNSIHTCMADSFKMDNFVVFSSMSLRDDILNKDSYFMVEIKALKRIFDFHEKYPEKRILCFVDEVLRGTNTVERIASCTYILRKLHSEGIITFAATHDIELTDLLSDSFDNYHFDEQIIEEDVIFNYIIKEGKATSRNAIKLLSIMGFSNDIIESATNMAEGFVKEGIWKI